MSSIESCAPSIEIGRSPLCLGVRKEGGTGVLFDKVVLGLFFTLLDLELESPDDDLSADPCTGNPGTPELLEVMAKLVLDDSSIKTT